MRNGLSGIGAAFGNGQPLFHYTAGRAGPIYVAELKAIHHAVKLVERTSPGQSKVLDLPGLSERPEGISKTTSPDRTKVLC
jgi:hypothetical protein